MKKRILSIALTVALLISLLPLAAISVRAESAFVASADMITVLKKWEGFSKKPYWDYSQWTVGYGTRCPADKLAEYQANGIPEDAAEALLQEFLTTMGNDINSFIDKFGLTMTQSQFDALLSLSFNCGTNWLYQPSTLRTAVIEGWTGDDFLFAFGQWSNSGDETIPGLVRRRLAEADMYLNGNYTVYPPANYCYVQFNANGGESEIVVQGYDSNVAPAIRAVPTYGDFVFEGWYTDPTGGEKVTTLDASVKNYTLYAHWRAGEGADAPQDSAQEITGTAVKYTKQVTTGILSSFQQPVKGALVVDAFRNGDVVEIVSEYTDAAGIKWGKVADNGGWINLTYTQDFDGTTEEEGPGTKITVTATDVNLRRGPGTSYAVVGKANKGDTLEITSTANGGGYVWGKSSKGWIALKFTDYNTVVNGGTTEETKPEETKPEETTPPTQPENKPAETVVATGKVKLQSGVLNVRSGPSTGHGIVHFLNNGEAVSIYETKDVGAAKWGRIQQGWICLTYVTLDNQGTAEQPKEEEKPATNPESGNPSTDNNTQVPADAVTGKIVLTSGRLNIRSDAGTHNAVVGWLSAGEKVTITQRKTVNGTEWGKIEKGWICMDYVSLDSASGNTGNTDSGNTGSSENTNTDAAGAVTGVISAGGSKLRIRTGPGSNYSIAGYLNDGSSVEILEQKTVGATVWGRTQQGWISMTYVKVTSGNTDSSTDTGSTDANTGTVIADVLNVRSGAGIGNAIVGRLYYGQVVTVTETKEAGGMIWGKISTGWICMDYIKK